MSGLQENAFLLRHEALLEQPNQKAYFAMHVLAPHSRSQVTMAITAMSSYAVTFVPKV